MPATRKSARNSPPTDVDRRHDPNQRESAWTPQAVRALGVSTDLRTAGQIFGMSATTAYKLVKQGRFPVPVIRTGTTYVVPVVPILAALQIDADMPNPRPAP